MNHASRPFFVFEQKEIDPIAFRLALLLVAGGHRTRRIVAGKSCDQDAEQKHATLPPAVVREAKEVVHSSVPSLLRRIAAAGWRWLTPEDTEYPATLSNTADPPLGLFVRGSLKGGPTAAIVGSRRATTYGLQAARSVAEAVAAAGGTVISGMARGIDTAAHTGALAARGSTWAVWATGPDRLYPTENKKLAEAIAERGALITEYPPGTPGRRHHFLERNRIIAGLSDVVVVVEAAARSGALNTARHAIDENRDVMAVPGSIFSEVSVGPNGLIRAGAAPVTTPVDVLETLDLETGIDTEEDDPLTGVLGSAESVSIDELAQRLGQPVAVVVALVLEMEVELRLERASDGTYRRLRAQVPNAPRKVV